MVESVGRSEPWRARDPAAHRNGLLEEICIEGAEPERRLKGAWRALRRSQKHTVRLHSVACADVAFE